MMSDIRGFLVVLEKAEDLSDSLNTRYKGMYRIPPTDPSKFKEERLALEAYVFGDFKNDGGFIPSREKARRILEFFRGSPRTFHIIYCETVGNPNEPRDKNKFNFLGFDIAGFDGDFWSPVGDFPTERLMQKFLPRLNEAGLFDSPEEAAAFLRQYRSRKLADYEIPLCIFKVHHVE